jgi:hypothetical protein
LKQYLAQKADNLMGTIYLVQQRMLQRAITKLWFISQYCNADWLVGTASVAIFNHFSTKNKLFELQFIEILDLVAKHHISCDIDQQLQL